MSAAPERTVPPGGTLRHVPDDFLSRDQNRQLTPRTVLREHVAAQVQQNRYFPLSGNQGTNSHSHPTAASCRMRHGGFAPRQVPAAALGTSIDLVGEAEFNLPERLAIGHRDGLDEFTLRS
ncbi:MAG: hypothetical protein QOH55_1685 [Microbacteriaceae bacterium]|nr:hypothetical protein [Microbacteriaceae bacterium]